MLGNLCFGRLSVLLAQFARAGILALFFMCLHAAAAKAAEGVMPVKIWEQGGMAVYAIQDRPTEMDISLFSGPATPEERARYFTKGKAPASINTFLIKTPTKNILVDSGSGGAESKLVFGLNSLDLRPDQIDAVLLTHMHSDHIGGLLVDGKRAFPKAALFVDANEMQYWRGKTDRVPNQDNQKLAEAVLAAYGDDVHAFPDGALAQALNDQAAKISAVSAYGHTPGHTVFLLEGETPLLIVGDLLHAASLQFLLPEECASYDLDKKAAAASRKAILNKAVELHASLAGMHLPFPGAGKVEKANLGFKFSPVQ